MTTALAFSTWLTSGSLAPKRESLGKKCSTPLRRAPRSSRAQNRIALSLSASNGSEEPLSREQASADRMRMRLQGLFGSQGRSISELSADDFDGVALRAAIRNRWGVEYDVQPQKRHGRVYVQIMWRYFEQQSFYMEEDQFACHCEAVAQLLQQWDAVDYFCDYISSIRKRPVVGVTINIPIPGVDGTKVMLE